LRVPEEDVSDWMRATGRVPLTHVHEGSVVSKFMNRLDGLLMRPSSAKPAFAIVQWRELPDPSTDAGAGVPRHRGFRIRVWLYPGENKEHLMKSMRAPAYRQTRSLAFCRPRQFGSPSAHLLCLAVSTSKRTMSFGKDMDGQYIEMESADPLLSAFGHRRFFRRDEVPHDAIWLVTQDARQRRESPMLVERDPKPPAGNRYWRLFVWPRWFFLPSLVAAGYTAALGLIIESVHPEGPFDAAVAAALTFIAVQALLIVFLDVMFILFHMLARWAIEKSWGSEWTAGTTGCVEDARKLRNGHLP